MRKKIMTLILAVTLCTSSVMASEVRAEAAATTVTVVSVAKAVLVLLAIAGVGIVAGKTWDSWENGKLDDTTVSTFLNWMRNRDPNFYTEFMVIATSIVAGRTVNTVKSLIYEKLKSYAREYFGTDTDVGTTTGTISKEIAAFQLLLPNDTYSYVDDIARSFGLGGVSQNVVTAFAFSLASSPNTYRLVMLPTPATFETAYANYGYTLGTILPGSIRYTSTFLCNGKQIRLGTYGFSSANFPYLKIQNVNATNSTTAVMQIAENYYSGEYDSWDEYIKLFPYEGVGDVAATSADQTVVGTGQTISQDENGDVVVDGGLTFDLGLINIDEWLKSLSEGLTSYEEAMEQIGVAAVNTQTQTLEEVEAIVQALNPAAAGTQRITGNYTVDLTALFPFCIPFDLYKIIQCFNADPVAPSATITLPVGYNGTSFTWEEYTVSLEDFNAVATVVRVFEYVLFIIGLMLITRKLIEG